MGWPLSGNWPLVVPLRDRKSDGSGVMGCGMVGVGCFDAELGHFRTMALLCTAGRIGAPRISAPVQDLCLKSFLDCFGPESVDINHWEFEPLDI